MVAPPAPSPSSRQAHYLRQLDHILTFTVLENFKDVSLFVTEKNTEMWAWCGFPWRLSEQMHCWALWVRGRVAATDPGQCLRESSKSQHPGGRAPDHHPPPCGGCCNAACLCGKNAAPKQPPRRQRWAGERHLASCFQKSISGSSHSACQRSPQMCFPNAPFPFVHTSSKNSAADS